MDQHLIAGILIGAAGALFLARVLWVWARDRAMVRRRMLEESAEEPRPSWTEARAARRQKAQESSPPDLEVRVRTLECRLETWLHKDVVLLGEQLAALEKHFLKPGPPSPVGTSLPLRCLSCGASMLVKAVMEPTPPPTT